MKSYKNYIINKFAFDLALEYAKQKNVFKCNVMDLSDTVRIIEDAHREFMLGLLERSDNFIQSLMEYYESPPTHDEEPTVSEQN